MRAGDAQPLFTSRHQIGIGRINRRFLAARGRGAPFANVVMAKNVALRTQQAAAAIGHPANNDHPAFTASVAARHVGLGVEFSGRDFLNDLPQVPRAENREQLQIGKQFDDLRDFGLQILRCE